MEEGGVVVVAEVVGVTSRPYAGGEVVSVVVVSCLTWMTPRYDGYRAGLCQNHLIATETAPATTSLTQ